MSSRTFDKPIRLNLSQRLSRRHRFPLLALLNLSLLTLSTATASETPLTFEEHIRPIFKANCFDCHGEGESLKGGLDLRLRRLMVQGGESGSALTPGQPENSLLWTKIREDEMPKRQKKLSDADKLLIKRWIAQGAVTARPEPEQVGQGMIITEEERHHWAFQPLRAVTPPSVSAEDRARTPVDAFLASELRPRKLSFSEDADKVTLIRRVTLDLWGLPPTPEEVERFLEDRAPDAYERLLDRLLESPHYGERWARHWLDVAGYADSDGYAEADSERPYAYKYRDYVIRALNADKPIDQFVVEQLAGDELVLATHTNLAAAVSDPAAVETLCATGYLRMGADGTAGSGIDQDLARNAVVADTIKIITTSLLGLSVGCAQCHDHRYEPIPQTDYYRLRALFEPAYDWKAWRNPQQRLVSLYTAEDRARAEAVEAEAATMAKEREAKQKEFLEAALEEHLKKFDEALRSPLRDAYHTPDGQRTAEQKQLLADHPSVNIHPGVLYQYNQKAADELKAMDAKIGEVRDRKPVEDFIQALTEVPGQIPVTYRFHRGDPKQAREAVGPGALTVLSPAGRVVEFPEHDPALSTTGRRLAFARWLTSTNQPLFARVFVNRIWMHHFGRGLVGTPSDFGVQGERPTHPQLLDWLAGQFMMPADATREGPDGLGWSLKRLHKLIMRSTAYRQSSQHNPEQEAIDPEDRYYWRKPVQRLDAEAIRDATLAVSGSFEPKMFGPPVPVREDVTGQIVVGVDKKQGDNKMPVDVDMGAEEFRRSVYVQVRRSRPLAFLNVFDAPVMEVNCERRSSSTVAPQALMLMNSNFILQQAARFADRVRREAGENVDHQIARAWQLAFCRPPAKPELDRAEAFLRDQKESLTSQAISEKKETKEAPAPEQQALVNLCQVLLSANEFLYVD